MDLTPFFTKLNHLETATLQEIQAHIETVMKGRLDTNVRPGRSGHFVDRYGMKHSVRIDKINRTTANCTETTPDSGKKWRIGLMSLKVDPIERKVQMVPMMPVVPHRPKSVSESAW